MSNVDKEIISATDKDRLYNFILTHRFIIPKNQRFYSWEDDLITQLMEDMQDCSKHKENLFLGITLFKGDPDKSTEVEIIDG